MRPVANPSLRRFAAMRWLFRDRHTNSLALLLIVAIAMLGIFNETHADSADPLIAVNRVVHNGNSLLDKALLKPVTRLYDRFTPAPVKTALGNVLGNLDEIGVAFNDVLQFRLVAAGTSLSRITINSTLGLGGMVNVADSTFGLQRHTNSFGLTLAHWGVPAGPYLVLPLAGPSTVREAPALLVDTLLNPGLSHEQRNARDKIRGIDGVQWRASTLQWDELVTGDEYLFLREAYLQNLEYRDSDGKSASLFDEFK